MLKLISNKISNGDTIIEVLFAITVFSLVAVGSLSIMNQGTATAQRALEITLVRQEIDAQAEALRFLNASYINSQTGTKADQWESIQKNAVENVSSFGDIVACPTSKPAGSFILNTRTAEIVSLDGKYIPASIFSQVRYNSDVVESVEGIWVEAVRMTGSTYPDNNQDNAGYIDFHIRACWDSPGQSVPVTLGTIVRLYEPQ